MDTSQGLFLGHSIQYWIDLNKKPKELKVENLLQEIVDLKGKLSFIELRLEEIKIII